MRTTLCTLAVVALALLCPADGQAQGFRAIDYASTQTNVAVTTTSETVAIASNDIHVNRDEMEVIVICYAQLTTGTNTTAVTPRIRRGTTTSGTLVNEANAEQVKAAAGSTEAFIAMVSEQRTGGGTAQYACTLQQTAASADGSILQASIAVMVR